jgi:hypothetical protein
MTTSIDEIKKITKNLFERGIYESQLEIIKNAIGQLAHKYSKYGIDDEKLKEIITNAQKKAGKSFSGTVKEVREV